MALVERKSFHCLSLREGLTAVAVLAFRVKQAVPYRASRASNRLRGRRRRPPTVAQYVSMSASLVRWRTVSLVLLF
jgi:hypothetical protein